MSVKSSPYTFYPRERRLAALMGLGQDLAAFAACQMRSPCAPDPASLPRGDGHPIIVFPGFLTSDWAINSLVQFLRTLNYDAQGWGGHLNLGPTPATLERLAILLEQTHHRSGGRKVSLIGRSLGGLFARALATDFPDKVARVITLGTPVRFPIATPLSPIARVLERSFVDQFADNLSGLAANPAVPILAIASREDRIVPFESCLVDDGPLVENYEIHSAHSIMGSNPDAMRRISLFLSGT